MIAESTEGIRKGLMKLLTGFPMLLEEFKPYIDNAIFQEEGYKNIHYYNTASISILKEMEMLFDDIVYQLSDQKATAIDELCEISKKVKSNMSIMKEQVDRVTIS
ncbi:hypothetical protein LC087_11515 [Bacillus carboniphilus]|uniref:LXG domain-containing protein n=1 Tax=Bacillus carboniphilus TaxID=86663 RepID=A0ABY9JQB5_9BACI|nr:hypothetical protein [Bacillus carboniphilus]WLR41517.1 hypothetical protein LC087_11515 [Bacillus carboniphilus]